VETIPTVPFLGLRLASFATSDFVGVLIRAASQRARPFRVAYLNAATVNLAFAQPEAARLLAAMDCLYADGQAVVWAARGRGQPIAERINAADFTRAMIRAATAAGLRVALIGGRPGPEGKGGEAERTALVFKRWSEGLRLVYTHHGYFKDEEAEAVRLALEQADPDLVLLGMGSPRQERWAMEWSAAGQPRAWWCVGALFEYYAGTRLRAPRWMRRLGLEWLVRLALEPGRLWRRYLLGNPCSSGGRCAAGRRAGLTGGRRFAYDSNRHSLDLRHASSGITR